MATVTPHCLAVDRVTFIDGDIFLADLVDTSTAAYHFERWGYLDIVEARRVKNIELDVDELRSPQEEARFPFSGEVEISGHVVSVTSQPPVEPSHLELYPTWSHFYIKRHRYLRGYLVNNTEQAYHSIRAAISFYNPQNVLILRLETEVFDVYAYTMKPFIIDVRPLRWSQVETVAVRPLEAAARVTPRQSPGLPP